VLISVSLQILAHPIYELFGINAREKFAKFAKFAKLQTLQLQSKFSAFFCILFAAGF